MSLSKAPGCRAAGSLLKNCGRFNRVKNKNQKKNDKERSNEENRHQRKSENPAVTDPALQKLKFDGAFAVRASSFHRQNNTSKKSRSKGAGTISDRFQEKFPGPVKVYKTARHSFETGKAGHNKEN